MQPGSESNKEDSTSRLLRHYLTGSLIISDREMETHWGPQKDTQNKIICKKSDRSCYLSTLRAKGHGPDMQASSSGKPTKAPSRTHCLGLESAFKGVSAKVSFFIFELIACLQSDNQFSGRLVAKIPQQERGQIVFHQRQGLDELSQVSSANCLGNGRGVSSPKMLHNLSCHLWPHGLHNLRGQVRSQTPDQVTGQLIP